MTFEFVDLSGEWKLLLWGQFGSKTIDSFDTYIFALNALCQAKQNDPDGWYVIERRQTVAIR